MFSKQFGKMEATVMDSFMGFFVGNIGPVSYTHLTLPTIDDV